MALAASVAFFPYPVVPVQFPGKGNPVCQYVQVGLLFLALRTAVPDDDVLVVRQPHALHEVVTKFRPVRIRKGGAFLYRGADLETQAVVFTFGKSM